MLTKKDEVNVMSVKVNMAEVLKMRQSQEIDKPYGSSDSKFPLFKTPVNERLLVYIPSLNVIEHEDGTSTNDVLETALHNYKLGKKFGTITCISGIDNDSPIAEILGYKDHTCPACDAVNECWNLVNAKTEAKAKELGINPENDPEEVLKPFRKKYIQDMVMTRASKYVTFPIVVIPHKGNRLTGESESGMSAYYVTMTEQRYREKVCASLSTLFNNPGHIGGRFMVWDFTYDSNGAQHNARDSAKNAKFNIIIDPAALQAFEPIRAKAEELAKEFTNIKALEVLTALEPVEYSKLNSSVDSVMKETRKILAMVSEGSDIAALPSAPEKILESFSATPLSDGNLGVTEIASADANATAGAHRFD